MTIQKPAVWIGSSKDDLRAFPDKVRRVEVIQARLKVAEAHYQKHYGRGAKA
jgi:phage-related protein